MRPLYSGGRMEEAESHYLEVLKADIGGHFSSIDVGILGYKTFHNLGGVCLALSRYADARDWWLKAKAINWSSNARRLILKKLFVR